MLGAGVHRPSGSRAADFKSVLKAGLQNGCTIGKRLRGALIGHFLLRWTEKARILTVGYFFFSQSTMSFLGSSDPGPQLER